MNKSELIDSVAEKQPHLTKKAIGEALESTLASIGDALKKGDEVQLIGFGTFYTGKREARDGRNPRTGETIKIKAAISPKFRAGKGLKDKLA